MGSPAPRCSRHSRLLFSSPLVTVGSFHCRRDDPEFPAAGPIRGTTFVFPRRAVRIIQEHRPPVVADPTAVVYYTQRQSSIRAPIDPEGDRSDWFEVAGDAAVEAVRRVDPAAAESDRPFRLAAGPSRPELYLAQRLLVRTLERGVACEPLWVEETVLDLLARAVEDASRRRRHRRPNARQRDLVEAARSSIATHFHRRLTLTDLAGSLGASPFHLSRSFSRWTGMGLHAYLTQLRLRAALELVVQPGADLMTIAFQLGFASHSHFTASFRRAFGLPPSAWRRARRRARM